MEIFNKETVTRLPGRTALKFQRRTVTRFPGRAVRRLSMLEKLLQKSRRREQKMTEKVTGMRK